MFERSEIKLCAYAVRLTQGSFKTFRTPSCNFPVTVSILFSVFSLHKHQQTCLPQLRTPNSLCPYFQISDQIFCRCTTSQSKQNSAKGQFFHHSSCKNSVSTHIFNYTDALHLDDFILFTSAKVVLDRRLQNTFSNHNAPCVLLSLTPMCPFLNSCCLVSVCFLGFVHSSSSSSVSCRTYHRQLQIQTHHIGRWLTSVKF